MLVAIVMIGCKGKKGTLRGRFYCRDCLVVGAQATVGACFGDDFGWGLVIDLCSTTPSGFKYSQGGECGGGD